MALSGLIGYIVPLKVCCS